ncbi:MAG: DNA mismatch repair protein MutS [Verrucomicrobia bacterium]|nr:MAG: DNA mismatch repair protein MutS [Verrucomicrobiota bacterium]
MPEEPPQAPDPADAPVEIPINGELDLHTFRPAEIKELIPDYIEACLRKRIHRLRIIHGKGTGTLRETVHAILRRQPAVENFHLADETAGGWGATIVELRPDTPPRSR